ncbi:MAG: alanine racemase [Clostridia bacterium]|nr:alanine racemase [Clostridia bacterium]
MLSVQVNLRTIIKNVALIKKQLKAETKFCAVVKSNAYGLGLERISKILAPLVDCFAVAKIDEAITLRQLGIRQDILLLGVCTDIPTAVKHNIIITLENPQQAENMLKNNLHPRIHIAVNTGMNRFGISSVHKLRKTLQLLSQERIEGFYSHLAYESDQLSQVQTAIKHFKKLAHIGKQYFPHAILHTGCSGVLNYPPAHFDMIRIGKALYGGITGTQTALTVTSKIIALQKLKPGESVGYNGQFVAKQNTIIAVVRGGYADGIPPQFSNKVKVLVGKDLCPIIGRVCMDYFFIDVSKVRNPLTKAVTIISPHTGQTLLAVAQQANMITCNLLLGLSQSKIKSIS